MDTNYHVMSFQRYLLEILVEHLGCEDIYHFFRDDLIEKYVVVNPISPSVHVYICVLLGNCAQMNVFLVLFQ